MELARIVAMAMIVVSHFIFHGIGGSVLPSPLNSPQLGMQDSCLMAMRFLFSAGTDLFILISGFYCIRLRWKNLLSFWLLCVFYNAAALFVNTPVSNIDVSKLVDVFLVSKTGNWFFQSYFWLMLASPVINKALEGFHIRALRCLAFIGLALLCITSWRFSNPAGSGPLLLMVLYFWGGYVRKEPFLENVSKRQSMMAFSSFVVIGIVVGIVTYDLFHKEYGIYLQHNCLLVVFMAVCLLLFFRKCEIRSEFINAWASSVAAVLFIHDVVLRRFLYGYVNDLYAQEGLDFHFWLMLGGLTIAVFAISFIIEWPRKKVAGKIAGFLSEKFNGICNLGRLLGNEKQ